MKRHQTQQGTKTGSPHGVLMVGDADVLEQLGAPPFPLDSEGGGPVV